MVRVLIDHEAVLSGAARDGAPWKFYDLGHSYCTNAFWSTCLHRMACVGCSFNLPKASARAMAVEAMTSVTRLLEEVPLSPDDVTDKLRRAGLDYFNKQSVCRAREAYDYARRQVLGEDSTG